MKFKAPEPLTEDGLKWAATDLDGTLAHSIWPELGIGEPIWKNIGKMNELIDEGYKIVIHTSRHWSDYEMIEQWLEHYNIPVTKIVCGKPLAKMYIDDKAINADAESWLP